MENVSTVYRNVVQPVTGRGGRGRGGGGEEDSVFWTDIGMQDLGLTSKISVDKHF